jgi:hypothetical protein
MFAKIIRSPFTIVIIMIYDTISYVCFKIKTVVRAVYSYVKLNFCRKISKYRNVSTVAS